MELLILDRPFKICTYPGCNNIHNTRASRCSEHMPKKEWKMTKDLYALYNSPRWRGYASRLRAERGVCANFDECRGAADVVDHIKPVRLGGKFWDTKNHQCLCKSCHAKKSAKERTM